MADKSLCQLLHSDEVVTKEFPFEAIDESVHLLTVNAGTPIRHAIATASCLDESVRDLLGELVSDCGGEMSPSLAYMCAFSLRISEALRAAAGVEV